MSYAANKTAGLTLVEVLLSFALFSVIIGITTSLDLGQIRGSEIDQSISAISDALYLSRTNTATGRNDDAWSVELLSNQAIVFKGSSFTGRDQSFDEVFDLTGTTITSVSSTITFDGNSYRVSNPTTPHQLTITDSAGNDSVVEVNEYGYVN